MKFTWRIWYTTSKCFFMLYATEHRNHVGSRDNLFIPGLTINILKNVMNHMSLVNFHTIGNKQESETKNERPRFYWGLVCSQFSRPFYQGTPVFYSLCTLHDYDGISIHRCRSSCGRHAHTPCHISSLTIIDSTHFISFCYEGCYESPVYMTCQFMSV